MKFEVGPSIVRDGLVMYLDAGNVASYTSGSNTWYDLIGVNNGTLTNGPTFDTGSGGSIVFDGINQYVRVPNTDALNPNTGSFTIMCWVNSNPSAGGDGYDVWIGKRAGQPLPGYYVGGTPFGANFMLHNDAFQRTDIGLNYTFDTWAMFTAILDRNPLSQTFIRDNFAQVASVTPAGGNYYTPADLSIGGDRGANSFYVNGKQAIVLIYNRALTPSEVTQNYNVSKTRFGL